MLIRPEKETDTSAIHSLNVSAFETSTEADLVDALRQQADPIVSIVAECDATVVYKYYAHAYIQKTVLFVVPCAEGIHRHLFKHSPLLSPSGIESFLNFGR